VGTLTVCGCRPSGRHCAGQRAGTYTSRSGRLKPVLTLAIALIAAPAWAQLRESITVEVIDVPVFVIDRDGKPVRGLGREAFTLLIDGRARPIEYFDVIDFGVAQAPAAVRRPQRERRLYLLLFDLTFKQTQVVAKLVRAQKAAEKAIEASNPSTDLFAIATYSTSRGVQFVTPFLADRAAIKRALYTLSQSKAQDALGLEITPGERSMVDLLGPATDMASAEILDVVRGGVANQEMAVEEKKRVIESQFDGLSELATRLAGLEGQKHVLLFTVGFEATLVHDINRRGEPPRVDARLMRILEEMHRRFQSAGVILDGVDIAGLRHTFNNLSNDALFVLARGTGGQVVQNKNDLTAAITDLTTSQQIVYLLGFRRTDNRPHRIDVRVNGAPRGSDVFHRTGFGEPQKLSVDALKLADIILNDIPQNGFAVDLNVALAADVVVRFHRAEVMPQLDPKVPQVDVLLYVFKASGESVASRAERISFEHQPKVESGDIEFRQRFDLEPGAYVAKALLRVAGTTSLGYARTDFIVPASP
jgi:VWFA-related protein